MTGELHQRLQRLLEQRHCDIGASECHGILCGMLSGPAAFDLTLWITHFSGQDDISAYVSNADHDVLLRTVIEGTRDELDSDGLEFELLLPSDRHALEVRAAAFADWCRGYLSGLGLSGLDEQQQLGEDARGFLRDLQQFGAIDLSATDDEAEESALNELSEFTRMGVLIVRAEARALVDEGAGDTAARSIH